MAPSQLAQLKSALTTAGLSRKSHSKKEKKAYKKGGARETDRQKKDERLEEIRRNLNKFDQRETKLKHDVGGRNLKGVTGRPSAAKQAGLDQRRQNLLPEHQLRDHTGTFRDRRFGESDPSLSLDDRMLERYTRERQRGQGKKGMFNIEDNDAGDEMDIFGFGDEGNALGGGGGGLTHGGRSVMDLPGDDFVTQGLGDEDDDDEEEEEGKSKGAIDKRTVGKNHFGGFGVEPEAPDQPERKKSKQEVMSEIIAKSKDHKHERQMQREMDADLRDQLDNDMEDLQALLQESAPVATASTSTSHIHPSRQAQMAPVPTIGATAGVGDEKETEQDYDQVVKALAFDARAKPKDRTKTEAELAAEEKERLEKAEARRLRRMRGEEGSEDEDGEGGKKGKKRKVDERREGDDLDDDFVEEDDLLGPGLTREAIEQMGGEDKIQDEDEEEEGEDDEDEEEEEDEDDSGEEEDKEESEGEEPPLLDGSDLDEEDTADVESEVESDIPAAAATSSLVRKGKGKAKSTTTEIPYTFPCPASIDEFEDILEGLDDSVLSTVVQRIRALHHPSLASGNKERLQTFLGVLLDYTLILASRPVPAFDLIATLTPHLIALVKLNPLSAAGHFISKLSLMQKNLTRGLARGASKSDSKTYPSAPELVILRLVGGIWSTSDFSHPVVAPAVLLMGQYLGHGRIRRVSDLASGLFISSLLLQYEGMSKRVIPEALNFLAAAITALLPRKKDAVANTIFPDLQAAGVNLFIPLPSTASPREPVDLGVALDPSESANEDQTKVDLLSVSLTLIQSFASLYSGSTAFIELFTPLLLVLQSSRGAKSKLSEASRAGLTKAIATLDRMLNLQRSTRQPLVLQAHKPIPIASHAPRFEDDFAPGRHYDPDVERNAAQKLKALYKKERKGAIRELRKDNKFLAGEKAREQAEKDREYTTKMRRVEGGIQSERAEEKSMQREKAREKRRAGRK